MHLARVWLTDFRNYDSAELGLGSGLTVITGRNGEGKTNLLEALGFLATLESIRGVPNEALVRVGCERGFLRGAGERLGRQILVEAEVTAGGRGRVTLNRQPVRRASDLQDGFLVSVFSPDDLELVKGGPAGRRRYLDDALVTIRPRHDLARRDLERILRQRTALLRQIAGSGGGRSPLAPDMASTLAVWDAKLIEVGESVGAARQELVDELAPRVADAYLDLAEPGRAGPAGPPPSRVELRYEATWRKEGLPAALAQVRTEELRRGACLVGPHRDELALTLGGMPGRTHASQGEQRCLALALRLAAHRLATDRVGEPPVLLLDDVFSELDAARSRALLEHLPSGQAVLTTTAGVPAGAVADQVLGVAEVRGSR